MIIGTEKDFEVARKVIAQFDKKTETVMFKVNHLAPGKMAGIVCHKVFKSDEIKDEDEDSEGKGGAKIACSSKDIDGSETEGTFSSFKSNGLVVTYYPDLGTIGVSGATREQIALVDEVIQQNDIKQPQAILEIAFIELSADGSRQLNPSWAINAGTFQVSASDGTLGISFANTDGDWESELPSGFSANLVMSIKEGKGRVLANPKILVRNNTESTLDITQEYISNITTQMSTAYGQAGIESQTVEKDESGIKMTIKPTITPDGYVYLDLNPSYSVPNGSFAVSDAKDTKKVMELVAERSIELKGIRVKDNETLIIAGLINESEKKTSNKIPYVGDVPFLGTLFRNSSRTSKKTELIILITPKILNDDDAINERM